jgi:acyl carrier protein
MVPSAFVFLDAWPLTANGKVDRNELPTPDLADFPSSEKFVAPRNPLETTVAKTWSSMLGRARLGIHDNFFECGGHSLLAAQAVSRLKESFNIQLSIRSLFEKPTVAEFAKEIERRTARPPPQRGPGLTRVSREPYRVNPVSSNAARGMSKHN